MSRYYTKVLTCVNHPSRPAARMCRKCGDGLCKHCPATYVENDGYHCPKCMPKSTRGVYKFNKDL